MCFNTADTTFCRNYALSGEKRLIVDIYRNMKLFVIDLNGVLCYSVKSRASPRPFLIAFLQCIERLHDAGVARFAIWTSKTEINAQPIIKRLLVMTETQSLMEKLLFCWYASECTMLKDYTALKDLERIWSLFPEYTQKNTYLIDDSAAKIGKYINNLISITTYSGPQKMPDDRALLTLCDRVEALI